MYAGLRRRWYTFSGMADGKGDIRAELRERFVAFENFRALKPKVIFSVCSATSKKNCGEVVQLQD
jgi:hypothetical protein